MKRVIIAIVIAVVAIASVTAVASARSWKGKGKRSEMMQPRMMRGMRMMEALNLTDAQKEKLQALRTANAKAMAKLQANAKIAQIELQEVMRQDAPKTADVKAKVAAVNKIRGQIMEARTLHGLEMKQVLTPEQRAKMKELKSKPHGRGMRGPSGMRRGGFRGHRGMMRPGGPMPQAPAPGN